MLKDLESSFKNFPKYRKIEEKKNRKHRETQLLLYPVLTSLLPTRLPPGIALIPNSMEERPCSAQFPCALLPS